MKIHKIISMLPLYIYILAILLLELEITQNVKYSKILSSQEWPLPPLSW